MKGTSHFHSLTSEDNLALKNARKISKLVSEVSQDLHVGRLPQFISLILFFLIVCLKMKEYIYISI